MTPRLLDLFLDDLAAAQNTAERRHVRRYWLLAVIETLHERALTVIPLVRKRRNTGEDRIERFPRFWHKVPDDQLYELADHLKPYFKRAENRAQPL